MARISTADTTGTIAGTVRAKQSGQPIVGVNVIVLETHWGAATDLNGKYRILSLPEGKYNLKFSHIAFQENMVRGVKVTNKKTVTVDVELEATVIEGEMVMVTPRTEYFDASGLGARLSRKMVDQTPGAAQDIFWVLQTLPGIASGSDNSKLYVRGGSPDENLVIFDGATIKSPFHFDFLGGGFFSILFSLPGVKLLNIELMKNN